MLSFRKLAWAHHFFQPCRSNSYWQVLGKAPFDSTYKDDLFTFLNNWQCRITRDEGVRSEIIAAVRVVWGKIGPEDFPYDFLTCDAIPRDAYEGLSDISWLNRDGSGRTLGPTATSKILHVLRPGIFIMWDAPIRAYYDLDGSSQSYEFFISLMKKQVESVLRELHFDRKSDSESILESKLCNRLGCNHPRPVTMPKLIDEYNWIAITNRLIDDRIHAN